MITSTLRRRLLIGSVAIVAVAATAGTILSLSDTASSGEAAAKAAPALPVSVSVVQQRDVALWDEFSGRLEAIERVEVRSRVAGAVQSVHFREGALVKQNDLLITIDPAPYAAEVERAEAQAAAAQARVLLTKNEVERGQQLSDTRTISARDLDQRTECASRGGSQSACGAGGLAVGKTESRLHAGSRAGRGPRRQAGNHRR